MITQQTDARSRTDARSHAVGRRIAAELTEHLLEDEITLADMSYDILQQYVAEAVAQGYRYGYSEAQEDVVPPIVRFFP